MLSSLIDAFKVPELRKKILFTLGILALYRFGAYVPVPGIPFHEFANTFQDSGVSMTMLDLFTGGALSNFSVFSLGIMPYITASIIMQLMQGVIPAVGRWAKEGETGRRRITQVTRYLTLALGLINAIGYLLLFKSPQYGVVFTDRGSRGCSPMCIIVFTLVAGTAFIMWMGELITQRGVGNGMSLIIFVSIVSRVPSAIFSSVNLTTDTGMGIAITVLILAVVLVCIPAIIFIERAQRRIPVNYAKRVQGRKLMGGQSTYIPLKVNAAGVIPIIFASCLIYFPAQLAALFNVGWLTAFADAMFHGLGKLDSDRRPYRVLRVLLHLHGVQSGGNGGQPAQAGWLYPGCTSWLCYGHVHQERAASRHVARWHLHRGYCRGAYHHLLLHRQSAHSGVWRHVHPHHDWRCA